MIVLVPSSIYACMNIVIFVYRQDIRLLRYMVFTFSVFLGGWCPLFILIATDFGYAIPSVVYITLAILAEASLVFVINNLFR